MNKKLLAVLMAAVTGLGWAVGSPASKLLGQEGVDMSTVVLLRCAGSALFMGFWLRIAAPRHFRLEKGELRKLFFMSLIAPVLTYLGFMLSVVYLPVATALVLHYTNPILTSACSSVVTRERPTVYDMLSAAVVVAGVTCSVLSPDWTLNMDLSAAGILWSFVSVVGISVQALCGRASATRGGVTGLGTFYYTHLLGIFWIALYKTFAVGWSDVPALTPYQWQLIGLVTLFTSVVAYSAFYVALRHLPAPTVSLIMSIDIPAAVTLTAFATGSWPTLQAFLGCSLILTAIGLSILGARKLPVKAVPAVPSVPKL